VNGKRLRFDAKKLGEILGVSAIGFDIYVQEDKSVPGNARLLELSQKLSQQIGLKTPQTVKKGDMTFLHQLLFWFIIKKSSRGVRVANLPMLWISVLLI